MFLEPSDPTRSAHRRPWIIASPVDFQTVPFNRTRRSLCSNLGNKLHISGRFLPPPLFLRRSLRQNQEADDPYLLVD